MFWRWSFLSSEDQLKGDLLPTNQKVTNLAHQCTNGCFKNVPLQSCGSVCRVIVVVMGAIRSLYPTLWRAGFLDPRAPVSNEFLWLRNPTLHSCFLRRVLIHWICSKDIDLQLLGIQGTNQVSQHPTVPSSTGTAQKPLPVTGQKQHKWRTRNRLQWRVRNSCRWRSRNPHLWRSRNH